jgi:hypothetical protein
VTLAERLEELLGARVDLVSRRAIKPSLWKLIAPELIEERIRRSPIRENLPWHSTDPARLGKASAFEKAIRNGRIPARNSPAARKFHHQPASQIAAPQALSELSTPIHNWDKRPGRNQRVALTRQACSRSKMSNHSRNDSVTQSRFPSAGGLRWSPPKEHHSTVTLLAFLTASNGGPRLTP